MKNYRPYSISKIRSFRDLREEKLRLKAEIMRIEERMQSNYSNIKEALSPANVLKSILLEITASAPWISGVYSIGQKIFAKKKKKKKAISVDSDNILP